MKRIKEQQSSGREPEPASDAISSRTLGNAGRQDDHRGSRSWACRRLWPQSASPGVDASLLRASHLRTDRRSSQWHGRGDFEAAGGAAKLETFRAEDAAVLKAGLCGAYVTVDDTGARLPARTATPRKLVP